VSFETALRDELFTIPELAGKVHPLNAPEGTKAPYLVYLSSEGLQDKTLQGYLATKEVSCELNILHSSYANLKALTANVLTVLRSFQSRTIGTNGPYIQDITYEEPVELYEELIKQYRCNINIQVYF
jgi:hypothetical protein